jgi:hypothetical protein
VIKQSKFLTGCFCAFLALFATSAHSSDTETYTYDALGRLITTGHSGTINNGKKHSLCYDKAGNRTAYKSDSSGAGLTCATGTTTSSNSLPVVNITSTTGDYGNTFVFAVTLSTASTSAATVNYATAEGTAVSTNYTATSGTLTFAPGQTSKSVSVVTNAAGTANANKTFYVNLSAPTGATLGTAQAVGTILGNLSNGGCNTC